MKKLLCIAIFLISTNGFTHPENVLKGFEGNFYNTELPNICDYHLEASGNSLFLTAGKTSFRGVKCAQRGRTLSYICDINLNPIECTPNLIVREMCKNTTVKLLDDGNFVFEDKCKNQIYKFFKY